MRYKVETLPAFDRAVKRLRHKYRRVKEDLQALVETLSWDPFAGMAIPGFAHKVWKIRLASTDMRVEKRGGYRVIYAVRQDTRICYLLYMYAKPQKADVTVEEIEALLAELEAL